MESEGRNGGDDVLVVLAQTLAVLRENMARLEQALRRGAEIREQRLAGRSYQDILEHAQRPLLIETITTNLRELQRAGHELRRAEAMALRDEGVSLARIAELFGVSPQRVSAILKGQVASF